MCCCSKQPVRGEKTSDPRTGCVGDYGEGEGDQIHPKPIVAGTVPQQLINMSVNKLKYLRNDDVRRR
jgi:hypothetical protein